MSEKITGVAEKIKQDNFNGKDKYGLFINSQWYNGWGKAPCNQGDTITFDYEDKKSTTGQIFHNVKLIHDVKKTGITLETPGEVIGESAKLKRRAEMMRCAVDICRDRKTFTDEEIMAQYVTFVKAIGEELPSEDSKLSAQ